MNISLPWNAIHTRANCEKKVISQLEKKGIAFYYPLSHPVSAGLRQQKRGVGPLFPSIIFIQLPADMSLASLGQIPYVTNLLYWKEAPAAFPANEITQLRNFLEMHTSVQAVKTGFGLNKAMHNEELRRVQYSTTDSVYTMDLPSMGYTLVAKTDTITNIRLLRKNAPHYKVTESLASILGFKSNR